MTFQKTLTTKSMPVTLSYTVNYPRLKSRACKAEL